MFQRSARGLSGLLCSALLVGAGCGSSTRTGPARDAARDEHERGRLDSGGDTGRAVPGDGGRGHDMAESDSARGDGGDAATGADAGRPAADGVVSDGVPGVLDAADASRADGGGKGDGGATNDGGTDVGRDEGRADEGARDDGRQDGRMADAASPSGADGPIGSDVGEDGGMDGRPPSGWAVAGRWPTYGYAAAQTRAKVVSTAFPAVDPSLAWKLTLPLARHTMFYSSATSGPDGTLYIPFFGIWDNYPAAGSRQ